MNLDDAIKAFESPRPNGWFRDDEVKAALEALREKKAREKSGTKRSSLNKLANDFHSMHNNAHDMGATAAVVDLDMLLRSADILCVLDKKVVPWMRARVHLDIAFGEMLRALGEDA